MNSAGSRLLSLKPLQVAGFQDSIDLSHDVLRIGRAKDNDLALFSDSFPSVSGHHAQLTWRADELWVEDLGSRNGTVVNGESVQEARLKAGDVLRLGPIGPRFLVAAGGRLEETAFVDPSMVRGGGAAAGRSEERMRKLLDHRTKRILLGTLALLVGFAAAAFLMERELEERRAELDSIHSEELAAAQAVIDALSKRQSDKDKEYAAGDVARDQRESALRAELAQLLKSRGELTTRLNEVEQQGQVGQANSEQILSLRQDLAGTRTDLIEAQRQVRLFDPVNLEASRLSRVAQVRRAVVLLESQTLLVHETSGDVLHVERTPLGGEPNFEGRGEPWTIDSTGSGFCVSEDGWILTNAHVIAEPVDHPIMRSLAGLPISMRQSLMVVYSGSDVRHEARVERLAEGSIDLALVHILPFEGMPYLDDFDVYGPAPDPGSDVFLFGFPLGNFALQEGQRVIASTFRGILSRYVDGVIQVDAGVHPGNSGGPITDAQGNVLGVVVSVQALPDRTAVYSIGYGLPIDDAASLWPPPDEPSAPFGAPAEKAQAAEQAEALDTVRSNLEENQ